MMDGEGTLGMAGRVHKMRVERMDDGVREREREREKVTSV